jgi:hypothetical protein
LPDFLRVYCRKNIGSLLTSRMPSKRADARGKVSTTPPRGGFHYREIGTYVEIGVRTRRKSIRIVSSLIIILVLSIENSFYL